MNILYIYLYSTLWHLWFFFSVRCSPRSFTFIKHVISLVFFSFVKPNYQTSNGFVFYYCTLHSRWSRHTVWAEIFKFFYLLQWNRFLWLDQAHLQCILSIIFDFSLLISVYISLYTETDKALHFTAAVFNIDKVLKSAAWERSLYLFSSFQVVTFLCRDILYF